MDSQTVEKVGQEIYDGTAAYGRFTTLVGAVIGGVIGTVMVIAGIITFFTKPDYSIQPGVFIRPNNIENRQKGLILILVGFFFAGATYLSYWAASKWKFIAAADGAGGILDLVQGRQ
jgi:multisubunit Na+/H+ antiporter MnhB subunit